jgi:hypothetical protein
VQHKQQAQYAWHLVQHVQVLLQQRPGLLQAQLVVSVCKYSSGCLTLCIGSRCSSGLRVCAGVATAAETILGLTTDLKEGQHAAAQQEHHVKEEPQEVSQAPRSAGGSKSEP